MKRSKHSLSHYKLLTLDMGKLVPVSCFEVLPGDTIQQASSCLVRVSPLLAPVMHPVTVRLHHWFVPNRIIWDGWEDFITGGQDGLGEGAVYPTKGPGAWQQTPGNLGDYFGIPPSAGVTQDFSILPFRAYALIFNENYRDQDLVPALPLSTAGGVDATTYVGAPANIAWEKDQFTNSRPWPQRGPDVSMPLGVSAPVIPTGTGQPTFVAGGTPTTLRVDASNNQDVYATTAQTSPTPFAWSNPALVADLTNASAVNVNDVRRAFALQRYQEARAQYGARFTEYLRYLGIRSSDARLQRPEYLGGGKQTISFSEVLRTGSESTAPIGEMAGHGIAAMRSRRYRKFFEEHGHVLTLMSVRPRTMYQDGVHKMWLRRTKEDYWQKELELIGQEEVRAAEVYAASAAPQNVFGYNDRYYSYRHLPSGVSGEFRDILNYWHLGRQFAAEPALNQSFIECDPSKRIHAENTQHALWVMTNHSIQARRMVTRQTIGRIM